METRSKILKLTRHRAIVIIVVVLAASLLGIVLWRLFPGIHRPGKTPFSASPATYIGENRCVQCHAQEAEAWLHSNHARAMQLASSSTVLGDFNNSHYTKDGVTSTFYEKDLKFFVRTDGPDGGLRDYPILYTFGVFPLQQYLVPFPGGRLQSLGIAWDSRPKDQGGRRWFHLYPDQKMTHANPLYWTGRNQTWNYMCASCHSTDLRANYDLANDSYATQWSEINVSCESCHGPGSAHEAWAQARQKRSYQQGDGADGLVVNLSAAAGSWSIEEPDPATMHWKGQARSSNVVETCAPCHSRRHPITRQYQPGQPYLDAYVPALLEEGIYYPDGQILEEDYEYGSFLQSKMYRHGVSCSDCHDPHRGKLFQVSMNSVCGKCHLLSKFGNGSHHHHKGEGAGALCINCHMAMRTYMVIDVRRDHSFRVPRPDFSLDYGTPNACNQCHTDKSSKWAAEAVAGWYGPKSRQEPHFLAAIDAGRRGLPEAEKALAALIADSTKPGIARATALRLLPQYLTPASIPTLQAAIKDSDALVRSAAVRALEPLPPQPRVREAAPLLTDPIRSVRIEAARLLAGISPDLLQEGQKTALDRAIAELIASEMVSAERPENHLNLALLYVQTKRMGEAEQELQTALRLDPDYIPAMVNLADLYRMQTRDDDGQRWLEKAITIAPNAAEAVHAMGLLKIRQKQYPEAIRLLARAARLQPGNVRYSYVYAVALHSSGQAGQAITILERAHARRPADREILAGLITFERERGNLGPAIGYAQQLVQLDPDDPDARTLLADLKKGRQ